MAAREHGEVVTIWNTLSGQKSRFPAVLVSRLVFFLRMDRSWRAHICVAALVPRVGLEPTPSCEDRILSPAQSAITSDVGLMLD